jgi:lipopolysaccharide exporter
MSWSYSGVVAMVVLQVVGSVFFARYLGAEIFGVFAFGLLVFPPFRILCEFGFGAALVDKSKLERDDVQRAVSRSMVLALAAAGAWLASIGFLTSLVHETQYAPALKYFALVLLALPIQTVCTALLTKELDQKHLQISSAVAYAGGYLGVGAVCALHDMGVWSLVLGFLAQNLLATLIVLARTGVTLSWTFNGDARFLWRFGSRVAITNLSNWLTGNLDNMVVAWFFGTAALGVYSVAYALVRTPADKLVVTLQNVLFPATAQVRGDRSRVAKACVATMDAVFLLTVPTFGAVAVLAETVVEALYGPSWSEASKVLPPLALSMILYSLTAISSSLLWGLGAIGRDMRIQWWSAAVFLLAIVFAGRYSIVAVAWTVVAISALRAVWGLGTLAVAAGISGRRVLRALVGGAMLGALVTPTLAGLDLYLRGHAMSALARLGSEILTGALLWALASLLLVRAGLLTYELQSGLRALRAAFTEKRHHA